MRFLQPIEIPDSCFLQEVLYWVTFKRIPVAMYTPNDESVEIRDSEAELDINGITSFATYSDFMERLDAKECAAADIPLDPRYRLEFETGIFISDTDEYDDDLEREMREWKPKYEQAIEYPAVRIFTALKEGKLSASGKALPDQDPKKAVEILNDRGKRLSKLPTVPIPTKFWSLSGIDWTSNRARNGQEHYCWIRCRLDEVLSNFPPEGQSVVSDIERVGTNFVLNETPNKPGAKSRGRPAYPWEAFHLEVTDLLLKGDLPRKKEAGIQHLRDWFEKTHDLEVSRSAIGQKLTPYYDRFIKSADRN